MRTSKQKFHLPRSRQRGAILVTSMLLLIVLTVLGVAMMRMNTLQERMAGNARDVNVALQAAEAALRDGEDRLIPSRMPTLPVFTTGSGCEICAGNTLPVAIQDTAQFDWSTAREYGDAGAQEVAGVQEDPRFVIEHLAEVREDLPDGHEPPSYRDYFQISARSTGASGQANVVLQSTFPRRGLTR